jgi:toxin YoeB
MKIAFSEKALDEYFAWQQKDRKTLRKINKLLISIQRDGLVRGLGKPELLRYSKNRYSRRIDEKNRLVYRQASENMIEVLSCEGHYED